MTIPKPRNIQIIDGAENTTYSVFAATEEQFESIFPGEGQDIEFIDDYVARVGEARAAEVLDAVNQSPVDKKSITGLHGTLFYEMDHKKTYYPTKREKDIDPMYISEPLRRLFKKK